MLFLFILMFYNHKIVVSVHLKVTEFFLALFFLLGLISILFNLLFVGKLEDFNFDEYVSAKGEFLLLENNFYNNFIFLDDMKKFGVVLFNEYYFEFLLIGLLLLIIMIGVVGILLNFYEYFLFLNENKEKNKNL